MPAFEKLKPSIIHGQAPITLLRWYVSSTSIPMRTLAVTVGTSSSSSLSSNKTRVRYFGQMRYPEPDSCFSTLTASICLSCWRMGEQVLTVHVVSSGKPVTLTCSDTLLTVKGSGSTCLLLVSVCLRHLTCSRAQRYTLSSAHTSRLSS